jgi:hypothetical protein
MEYVHGDKYWYLHNVNYSESDFNLKMTRHKELSIAEIEKLLGYSIVIVK